MAGTAATPLSDESIIIAYVKRDRDYPSFCCDVATMEIARDMAAAMRRDPAVIEVIGVFTLGFIRGNCKGPS